MTNKQLVVIIVYLLIFGGFGFAFGHSIGTDQQIKKYEALETEYKWKLDSCYQQIGDMQDDYDVNNDGMIDALDYVAIKKYILNQDINELGD